MANVALILGSYNFGGISRFVENLVIELTRFNLECCIIVREIVKSLNPLIKPYVIKIEASHIVDYQRKLRKIIRGFDIVNIHDVYSLGGIPYSCRSIFTYHGIIPLRYTKPKDLSGFLSGYVNLLLGRRKCVTAIGISDYIYHELLKIFPNVLKIPVGIRLSIFQRGRTLKRLKEDTYPVLLDVGPVDRSQGSHLLISSMYYILKRFPKAKLILVGNIVDPGLYHKVKMSEMRSHIMFTGFVPDSLLIDLYHTADIVIEIPYWHGFGLPILEAMACGKPVITRNAYAMKEHIQKSSAGVAIRGDNPQEVASAVQAILQTYDDMARRALNYARNFDISAIARMYKEIFTH
ncbi:MAG: glycosyltransferase family 4 protein [Ignisphaera sp.]